MASGEEVDSGMASQNEECECGSPEKTIAEGDFGDEPDESLMERLWGLTEMFPEPVRNVSGVVSDITGACVKGFYTFSRSALWIFFSSSIILFAPILMECERVQVEDIQRNQQKQMLLGPNTGVSGGMPMMPPISR